MKYSESERELSKFFMKENKAFTLDLWFVGDLHDGHIVEFRK